MAGSAAAAWADRKSRASCARNVDDNTRASFTIQTTAQSQNAAAWAVGSPGVRPIAAEKLKFESMSREEAEALEDGGGLEFAASMIGSKRSAKTSGGTRPRLKRQATSRYFHDLQQVRLRTRGLKNPWWLIDPRNSKWMGLWDGFTSAAILFTAFVTPYEVSFLPMATVAHDPLFIFNRLLDGIFIIDMLIQFVLIYADGDSETRGRWVVNPSRIAFHYLRGWFAIDAASIGVSAIDIVGVMQTDQEGLSSLRVFRALRALRLLKLARLLKASRIFRRWETKLAIDYTKLELAKCCVALVAISHWFGCVWALQASIASESLLASWMGAAGYCVPRDDATCPHPGVELPSTTSSCPNGWDPTQCPPGWECRMEDEIACLPGPMLYAASIYWAVMTITSIGYGDIAATPKNAAEQVICTVLMLIGGCLWGYVIGTFCGAIANLSPAVAEFRTNMNDLNGYIATNQINQPLARRLREFFHQTSHLADAPSHSRLLTMLSPALQSETVLTVNQSWLGKVWFLNHKDVSQPFVVRLAISLSPMILAPFEIAPHGYLYLLHRGVVVHTGRVLTKGQVWGEDIIVMALAPNLVRGTNARAMNYVESFITDWQMLEEVHIAYMPMHTYPHDHT